VIGLLAVLAVLVFGVGVITAPPTLQAQYTPDDAYYYLVLARNFAAHGAWTFDSGHSVTSGFHPLLAYILSVTYAVLRPTSSEFVRYSLVLSSLVTTVALSIAWGVGIGLKKPSYMALLALVITSANVAYNSVSGTEWSLVLLFSVLYWVHFIPHRSARIRPWFWVTLFVVGLMGSLARSDFGLVALSLFVASLTVGYVVKKLGPPLLSFAGLLGATAGLLLVFANNYAFTGSFLQSSAKMKAYWAQVYGSAHWRAVRTALTVLNLDPSGSTSSRLGVVVFAVISLLAMIVVLKAWREQRIWRIKEEAGTLILLVASTLCIVGYVVLYSRSGAIQMWYTANLIVPIFIILSTSARCVETLLRKEVTLWAVSVVVLLAIVVGIAGRHPIGSASAPWSHQQVMLQAGQELHQRDLGGKIGSWNAGIIGYYQGGTVINLDGLVNDDIYPYAVAGDLSSYLSERDIDYVLDFQRVFEDQKRRLKGGYDDADLLARLHPVQVFDDGEHPYWKFLTLYRVLDPPDRG
jgi:hypothetical protein